VISVHNTETEELFEDSHNCGTDHQESVRDIVWLSNLIELWQWITVSVLH